MALEGRVDGRGASAAWLIHEEGLHARDVDAMADLVTRETIFKLLRWSTGSFHFSAQPVRARAPTLAAGRRSRS